MRAMTSPVGCEKLAAATGSNVLPLVVEALAAAIVDDGLLGGVLQHAALQVADAPGHFAVIVVAVPAGASPVRPQRGSSPTNPAA